MAMMGKKRYDGGKFSYLTPSIYVKVMTTHRHLMDISTTNQPDIDVDNGGSDDEGGAKPWSMNIWEENI